MVVNEGIRRSKKRKRQRKRKRVGIDARCLEASQRCRWALQKDATHVHDQLQCFDSSGEGERERAGGKRVFILICPVLTAPHSPARDDGVEDDWSGCLQQRPADKFCTWR